MHTEYEATFIPVDKTALRKVLKTSGATLIRPEFLQKRTVFALPKGHELKGSWARVRDEGTQITMSVKVVDGDKIENQKEVCLHVDDFLEAESFLNILGCKKKAHQETLRELWRLNDVEITIDTWPFLDTFAEIEGCGESEVRRISEHLGFDWSRAKFCAVDTLYSEKYKISPSVINDQTPLIVFEMENPFLSNP